MAVLPDQDRFRAMAQLMRDSASPSGVSKPELRAALNATDDWIEANQGSFNTALPNPYRTAATLEHKTLLFCYVAMRRAGILKAEED